MLKKVLKISSILIAGIILASCTINKPAEQVRTITVTGTGSVSVAPDQVSLKFLVRTSDWNVNKACDKNAVNTTNVLNALKDAGIASDDIKTYDYRISQDNSKNYPGEYTVTNTIAVLIRNIESTGKIIDAAVKMNTGANGLTGFQFLVSDKTTALRQARTLAVQNAQDAANLLAGASGCRVESVIDIKEDSDYSPIASLRASDTVYGAVATPIEAGKVSVSSTVTITYQLAY